MEHFGAVIKPDLTEETRTQLQKEAAIASSDRILATPMLGSLRRSLRPIVGWSNASSYRQLLRLRLTLADVSPTFWRRWIALTFDCSAGRRSTQDGRRYSSPSWSSRRRGWVSSKLSSTRSCRTTCIHAESLQLPFSTIVSNIRPLHTVRHRLKTTSHLVALYRYLCISIWYSSLFMFLCWIFFFCILSVSVLYGSYMDLCGLIQVNMYVCICICSRFLGS